MASRKARSTASLGNRLSDVQQSVEDLEASKRGTSTADLEAQVADLTARLEQLESANYRIEEERDLFPSLLSPSGEETDDWNTAIEAGNYWGLSAANAPGSGSDLALGTVLVGSDGLTVVQNVIRGDGTFQMRDWVRFSADGGETWSDWDGKLSKHINMSASNGRIYFGSGLSATNDNASYIGLSPQSDGSTTNGMWVNINGVNVFTVIKDGHLNYAHGPFAMAAGSVSITAAGGATASASVSFPSGRFSATPHVFCNPSSSAPNLRMVSASNESESGATIYFSNTGGSSATIAVRWLAVQMTGSSGSG